MICIFGSPIKGLWKKSAILAAQKNRAVYLREIGIQAPKSLSELKVKLEGNFTAREMRNIMRKAFRKDIIVNAGVAGQINLVLAKLCGEIMRELSNPSLAFNQLMDNKTKAEELLEFAKRYGLNAVGALNGVIREAETQQERLEPQIPSGKSAETALPAAFSLPY